MVKGKIGIESLEVKNIVWVKIFQYESLGVDEFLDWQIDVDKFFNIMEAPKNMQAKILAFCRKGAVSRCCKKNFFTDREKEKGKSKYIDI